MIDLIAIAILATICGAEHCTEMEEGGEANEDWRRSFWELPNGIPSHDPCGTVFARVDPAEFKRRFLSWVDAMRTATDGERIARDGQTLRRSHTRRLGQGAIPRVSAGASRTRLPLGPVKIDGNSKELPALPEGLRLLQIQGCRGTIDAIGAQQERAERICEPGAEDGLALQDHPPTLKAEVEGSLEAACAAQPEEQHLKNRSAAPAADGVEPMESGPGRKEPRRVSHREAPEWVRTKEQGSRLSSLILGEARRELTEPVSTERRSDLSSLAPDANRAAEAVRGQWGIETSSHGVLEVVVGEEDSRVRVGNAPEKLALVRKLTHNWLQQEPTLKRGIQTQRLKAGWDRSDLLKILNVKPSDS